MIAELTRMREEREAAALEAERTAKRTKRLMWWSLRLCILWPLTLAGLWLVYHIGYESGFYARFVEACRT